MVLRNNSWTRRNILAAAALAALSSSAFAQQLWSSPATWGGKVPAAGETVVIPKGKWVALDVATPRLKGLKIEGTLTMADKDVAITSDFILVMGGKFQIGSSASPFRRRATITLTGAASNADAPGASGMGTKLLGVMGGCLEFWGDPSPRSWTLLAADAAAGSRTLTLAQAPAWRPGDQIVISTSSSDQNQFDRAEVASVSGSTVTLKAPLKFRHLGVPRVAGGVSVDVRAEVGLLSRNIVIQGDDQSVAQRFGGHAMFMNGMCPGTGQGGCSCGVPMRAADIRISGVEFRRMGQFNRLGRYPVHFHLMGEAGGSFIKNSSVHSSIQRGIVLHDVSKVVVSDNVVFDTVGHNLVVETDDTRLNVIERNLALVNRQPLPLFTNPDLLPQNDRQPANFWFKSGENQVLSNRAAGSQSSGFVYDGISARGPIVFRANVAHAAMGEEGVGAGDFDLHGGLLIVGEDARPPTDIIDGFLTYHNAFGIWPEETGPFNITRMIAADNRLQTENRGVGNRVNYIDATFIPRLTEDRGEHLLPPIHFQYGSDVRLIRPRFINHHEAGIYAATDIGVVHQARLWISQPSWVGTAPHPFGVGDDVIMTLLDNAMAPKGTYATFRELMLPGAVRAEVPSEEFVTWRAQGESVVAELDARTLAAPGTPMNRTSFVRRSDGTRYQTGMFGWVAVLNGGYRFDVEAPSPSGYGVRIFDGALSLPPSTTGGHRAYFSVPMASAPRSVHRVGGERENPGGASAANSIRRVATFAELSASPLDTYLYDARTRRVYAFADMRWLIINP